MLALPDGPDHVVLTCREPFGPRVALIFCYFVAFPQGSLEWQLEKGSKCKRTWLCPLFLWWRMFRCRTCEAEVRRPPPRTHRDAVPLGVGSEPRGLMPGGPGPERAGRGGHAAGTCECLHTLPRLGGV